MNELIIDPLELFSSIIVDSIIFILVSKSCITKLDYTFLFSSTALISFISLFVYSSFIINFGLTIIEILAIYLYFVILKKHSSNVILGSALVFGILDFSITTFTFLISLFTSNSYILDATLNLVLNILGCLLILKFRVKIHNTLIGNTGSILVGLMLYLYISSGLILYYMFEEHRARQVTQIGLFLIFIQTLFVIVVYYEVTRLQKDILTQEQQKQLQTKNMQLKEYSTYLEKNEDELRRFKHDYQNILSSLLFSAQEGNTQDVIKQLTKYTNSNFDEKALLKYKGVNHIHIEELKSIAIVKLAKIYNNKINYTFSCDKNIYTIPKEIDLLDLTRMIGIAFDNAIEESQALISKTGDSKNAKIEAMYYQDTGDFEFEIRNKIRKAKINTDKIGQKNYTTKTQHMGLGLSNVKKIANKYKNNILINYEVQNGWFNFELIILPKGDDLHE